MPENNATKLPTPSALASATCSAESLAEKLTATLLACGRQPCERVQLMVGIWPDDKPDGGMNRAALVRLFTEVIQQNDKADTPRKENR